MDTFLTKEEWLRHANEERDNKSTLAAHGERITKIELALFGDDKIPETVKNAILPTMVRLNTWLDMMGTAWRVSLGAVGGFAGLAVIAKTMGWV